MDAMPIKELITGWLEDGGDYCAMGVVGAKRGLDMSEIDVECSEQVAAAFGIAKALAREIAYVNDDNEYQQADTPACRWIIVRHWVGQQIKGNKI